MAISAALRRAGLVVVAAGSAMTGSGLVFALLPSGAWTLGTPALVALLALVVLPVVALGAWALDRAMAFRAAAPRRRAAPARDSSPADPPRERRVRHDASARTSRAERERLAARQRGQGPVH